MDKALEQIKDDLAHFVNCGYCGNQIKCKDCEQMREDCLQNIKDYLSVPMVEKKGECHDPAKHHACSVCGWNMPQPQPSEVEVRELQKFIWENAEQLKSKYTLIGDGKKEGFRAVKYKEFKNIATALLSQGWRKGKA